MYCGATVGKFEGCLNILIDDKRFSCEQGIKIPSSTRLPIHFFSCEAGFKYSWPASSTILGRLLVS